VLRRAKNTGREEAAYFLGFLLAGCFGGSDRACSTPMSTHRERSSSLVRSSGLRVRADQVPDPGGKILVIGHTAIVPSK
jgi:hypothetical protein